MKPILYILSVFICFELNATTWNVGSTQTYTMPSQLVNLVNDFDTILIDGGIYLNDWSKWKKKHLVIKGLGTGANRTILKSTMNIPNGKGIFVFELPGLSDNPFIENIVFDGAQITDANGANGAGIRFQSKDLTVVACKFLNCQNGILEGNTNVTGSTVTITNSEFENNGYQLQNDPNHSGYEHHLYINASTSVFTLRNCYFHHPRGQANSIKTRALANLIEYNLIDEGDTGYGSYELNIAQGGWTIVLGNVFIQGPVGANHSIVGYDAITNPTQDFYFVNNTVINQYVGNVKLFNISPSSGITTFKVYNNLYGSVPGATNSFFSTNTPSSLDSMTNLLIPDYSTFGFVNASNNNFNLTSNAISAINMGTSPGSSNGFSLTPDQMYASFNLPMLTRNVLGGALDIGAYEYAGNVGLVESSTDNQIAIYPNPSAGKMTIKNAFELKQIEVYTQDGKLIRTIENPTSELEIKNSGLYYLKMNYKSGKTISQIISVQ